MNTTESTPNWASASEKDYKLLLLRAYLLFPDVHVYKYSVHNGKHTLIYDRLLLEAEKYRYRVDLLGPL